MSITVYANVMERPHIGNDRKYKFENAAEATVENIKKRALGSSRADAIVLFNGERLNGGEIVDYTQKNDKIFIVIFSDILDDRRLEPKAQLRESRG